MNAKITIGLGGFLCLDFDAKTLNTMRNPYQTVEIKFGVGTITTRIDGFVRKVQPMTKPQGQYSIDEINALCAQATKLVQQGG